MQRLRPSNGGSQFRKEKDFKLHRPKLHFKTKKGKTKKISIVSPDKRSIHWRILMETSVRIREAMSTNLITARPDATVVEVARIMSEHKVGSIIITENGDNEGIVTERDICYKVVGVGKDPKTVFAKDIMTTDLVTIPSEKTITDAAKKMVKKGIRRLAV
ncbi:MAG TPA: CBS domain-containing protein, partial [Euryarchaeota archaeon]|nr:CBS domain-containing protein [Euryarchaeota archaeon]